MTALPRSVGGGRPPRFVGVAALALVFAFGSPSLAADGDPDPWRGTEVMLVVGEGAVAVAVEVPTSVVSFDAEDLLASGISDVEDLAAFTPNLEINSVFGASSPEIFIRGVGLKDTNANANSSVAVISDGVYLNSPVGQLAQFFDVESVNVLRGPQGTRYGRNASAGAIVIQSVRPSGDFGARLVTTYGRFDQVDIEGALEAPILPDLLALRFSGRLRKRDSIGENRCGPAPPYDFLSVECNRVPRTPQPASLFGAPEEGVNDRDDWALRGQLRLTPSSNLDVLLNVHGGRNRARAPSFQYAPRLRPNRRSPLWRGRNGYFDRDGCIEFDAGGRCVSNRREPERGDPFSGEYNGSTPEDLDLFGAFLDVRGGVGSWSFKSLTAYEENDRNASLDLDASPRTTSERTLDDNAWQITQELRFDWNQPGLFEASLGVFALHEELEGVSFFRAGLGRLGQQFEQKTDYLAIYGAGRVQLSERFSIEVGVRSNFERKDFSVLAFNQFIVNGRVVAESIPGQNILLGKTEESDLVPSGEVVLEYAATEDVRFYSKYVRGYKGRHINAGGTDQATVIDPSDPEFVNSFEVGFDTALYDGIVHWTGASFLYLYEGQQVFQTLTNETGAQPVDQLINAEDSRVFGVETELRIDWKGWTSSIAAAWLYSEYSDFRNEIVTFVAGGPNGAARQVTLNDFSGNQLVNAPEVSIAGNLSYDLSLGSAGTLSPRFDYRYRSRVFFTPRNFDREGDDARWVFDVRLDFREPSGRFEAGFWVRNIADEIYRTNTVFEANAAISDPRTYGGTVVLNF